MCAFLPTPLRSLATQHICVFASGAVQLDSARFVRRRRVGVVLQQQHFNSNCNNNNNNVEEKNVVRNKKNQQKQMRPHSSNHWRRRSTGCLAPFAVPRKHMQLPIGGNNYTHTYNTRLQIYILLRVLPLLLLLLWLWLAVSISFEFSPEFCGATQRSVLAFLAIPALLYENWKYSRLIYAKYTVAKCSVTEIARIGVQCVCFQILFFFFCYFCVQRRAAITV